MKTMKFFNFPDQAEEIAKTPPEQVAIICGAGWIWNPHQNAAWSEATSWVFSPNKFPANVIAKRREWDIQAKGLFSAEG